MPFQIKRVYEPPSPQDGVRVLVDRLWPRGMTKARAKVEEWPKDIAPSPLLRTWFGHEDARFEEFADRYRSELAQNPELAKLRAVGRGQLVTLLYGAHDPAVNHAIVLLGELKRKPRTPKRPTPVSAAGRPLKGVRGAKSKPGR